LKVRNKSLAAITLLAIILWCTACSFYGNVERLCESISVRWETSGISPAQLIRQQEYAKQDGADNQPEVTLWQETPEQEISDTGKRSAVASIITVFGNCEDITASTPLSGSFPARSDSTGCAVSSGLAFSLWGSLDVLGMPIELAGELFYVRGVFNADENRAFRQVSISSEAALSNMQLRFADGGSRDDAESYLIVADFSGGIILDLPLLAWVCSAILSLPFLLLALGILVRLIRRGMQLRHYPILLMGYLPFGLLAMCGLWASLDLPGLPSRLVPTMWSDFDFWKNLPSDHLGSLTTWLSYQPTTRDMALWLSALPMTLFALLASIFVMLAAAQAKAPSCKMLVIYCSVYMMALCAGTLLISTLGSIGFNRSMYLMPCLWLGVEFWLYWHERRLKRNARERNYPDDEDFEKQPELPAQSEELRAIPPLAEEKTYDTRG